MPEEKIKSLLAFLIFSVILLLNSCDAPRENPLDPNSSDNQLGTIEGAVQTFSLPYTPIKDVEVYWKPGSKMVYTDANGNFSVPNTKKVNGQLIFRKEGYHNDTVMVDWANSRKVNEQVNLNKLPTLDSLSIYGVVLNSADPSPVMSELVIQAMIEDIDNDIDTVYVLNDKVGLMKAMDFDIASKTFLTMLTPQELGLTDLEQTIGLEFDFRVRNVLGETSVLHGAGVKRIISSPVTGLQPTNGKIISSVPFNLSWDRYNSGYSFRYKIEISTDDGSQVIFSKDSISSQITSYTVDSLDTRSYRWVIWVIDEFNNKCRSIPAAFSVQ